MEIQMMNNQRKQTELKFSMGISIMKNVFSTSARNIVVKMWLNKLLGSLVNVRKLWLPVK